MTVKNPWLAWFADAWLNLGFLSGPQSPLLGGCTCAAQNQLYTSVGRRLAGGCPVHLASRFHLANFLAFHLPGLALHSETLFRASVSLPACCWLDTDRPTNAFLEQELSKEPSGPPAKTCKAQMVSAKHASLPLVFSSFVSGVY